jgi:outer membrane protein
MKTLALALMTSAALAAPAFAQTAGDMTLGFGIGYVNPKSNNGTLASQKATVDGNARPTITFEYFVRDNIGIELLAALPFQHDISLNGTKIGGTKHLPPTVSVNYHFPTGGKMTPFVGLGVNYTNFFDTSSSLGDLKIDNSWGLAAQAGVDFAITDKTALRMNVRYMDINSDVYLNGANIGEVEIDPVTVGVSYVMKF